MELVHLYSFYLVVNKPKADKTQDIFFNSWKFRYLEIFFKQTRMNYLD